MTNAINNPTRKQLGSKTETTTKEPYGQHPHL